MTEDNAADAPRQTRTPGPFWAWLVASVLFSQVIKRFVIGWQAPKPENFQPGNRFLENLVANVLLGLPVILVYLVCLWWMNRSRPGTS